mmetsp:Transcript_70425/g.205998  ORF Transcript_70425/g.205998 Transcript_70425/m.205998 type:complete len:748 (+) Transcript_70425:94-2337(+)
MVASLVELVGTWVYGSKFRFTVTASDASAAPPPQEGSAAEVRFQQQLSWGDIVAGTLRHQTSDGVNFLEAKLSSIYDGDFFGTINLRIAADNGQVYLKFRKAKSSKWGPEKLARRISDKIWSQPPSEGHESFLVVCSKVLVKRSPDPNDSSWGFIEKDRVIQTKAGRARDASGREWVELTPAELQKSCDVPPQRTGAFGFVLIDGQTLGLPLLLWGPLPRGDCMQWSAEAPGKDMFTRRAGYIASGDSLLVEKMTVEEAKLRCQGLPECQGFTFKGEDTAQPVQVHFKASQKVYGIGWTSYLCMASAPGAAGGEDDVGANAQGPLWRVVGGDEQADLEVRRGWSLQSEKLATCLACGAILEERAQRDNRLHFTKISGEGPESGWISIFDGCQNLVVEYEREPKVHHYHHLPMMRKRDARPTLFKAAEEWTPAQRRLWGDNLVQCFPKQAWPDVVKAIWEKVDRKAARGGPAPSAKPQLPSLEVYYMNVDPEKSRSSRWRRKYQDDFNPAIAAAAGYMLRPHRVEAVTPDSHQWKTARRLHPDLVMDGADADSTTGAVASCIVLSFREALRQASADLAKGILPEFVLVAEDDMVLRPDFHTFLEQAIGELRAEGSAMGGMLHSTSLRLNELDDARKTGKAVFRATWPYYPMVKNNDYGAGAFFAGEPVLPDQPLVALLKTLRLREFVELFERQLSETGWSPLDWMLAHEPFGTSGTLRLVGFNGFCVDGGSLGTGSDRNELHFSDRAW